MSIWSIFDYPIFSNRYKLQLHLLQFILVAIAMGVTAPRLFLKGQPRTRSTTYALGMGAKSIALLTYILLSEYSPHFQRWHSYKAHAIIPCLEIAFWSAVAGLSVMSNTKSCKGIGCTLSWIVIVVAIIIVITEQLAAGIAIREYRKFKERKNGGVAKKRSRRGDVEENVLHGYETSPPLAPVQQPKQAFNYNVGRDS